MAWKLCIVQAILENSKTCLQKITKKTVYFSLKGKKKNEKECFHSFTIVVNLRKNSKVIKIMKKFVYNKQV